MGEAAWARCVAHHLLRPTGDRIIFATEKSEAGGVHDRFAGASAPDGGGGRAAGEPDDGHGRRGAILSIRAGEGVVPFGAGGATDILARVFSERLQQGLGQSFTVENRGGAAGQIAAAAVARLPADGSTVMFTTAAPITIAPLMNDKINYDPRKDFIPVAIVAVQPMWLAISATRPEVRGRHRAEGKANPGKLTYGTRASAANRISSPRRCPLGRHPDDARAVPWRRRGGHRDARPADRFRFAQHRLDRSRA